MRVLFTTFANRSHLYEMVPLAWALHASGHEVRVASQPDLVDDITRAGLPAVAVGDELNLNRLMQEDTGYIDDPSIVDLDLAENRPDKLTWEYVLRVFKWHVPVMFEGLSGEAAMNGVIAYAREWRPDLVIWEQMTFFGPVAARASGAAHARMLFGQDFIGRMRSHFVRLMQEQPPQSRVDPMAEWLYGAMKQFGGDFDEDLVVGQWSIDCSLPWMRLPLDVNYVPVRFVPYHGPVAIPEWLPERPNRPRICLTAGLGGREVLDDDLIPFSTVFEAVADLDIEVIATLNSKQLESVQAIPENVRVFDFFPLNVLLPTCSAVIHHGGGGAFGTAVTHGVPQLILAGEMWWDAVAKAKDLAARGAGLFLSPEGLTADVLKDNLVRLLEEPSFRAGAAETRAEFLATPSPADIVPLLEQLTAKHQMCALR